MAAERTARTMEQQAARLQQVHQSALTANAVRWDSWWGQQCRAYNLHIELSASAREALGRVQAVLGGGDSGLLAVPAAALHISVAWLLAIHADYEVPKDELWQQRGPEWSRELARIAAEAPPVHLRYERLVATDSAIIALAAPAGPINDLRQLIRRRVDLPPQTDNTADLVHTSLCRYRHRLDDPSRLLATVRQTSLDVPMPVNELIISQECVYPSLETLILDRLPLHGRTAPGDRQR